MSEAAAPAPRGRYVAAVVHGDAAHSAGMTPRRSDGVLLVTGRVGAGTDLATAVDAAGLAARNALAACADAAACAGRTLLRPVAMTVWVACTDAFTAHSAVADGASAVLADHFGQDGLPARAAVGVCSLPGGSPVEVALVVALAPDRPR
ncbi:RidA family protein [Pseudonocardia sp. DR1-2]|uniref:RidA family protein n=1 Tax=Pseudonocardia sp. DR1-2 TaxID=2951168 RepID=UPI002042F74B|nr:RidA family protein [Pseudonocardia sp. DR1-2]MCM3849010.1 RidA family protein [Pseudonocardia sp. DR1-2]